MKRVSWEIVLAGLVFLIIGVILLNKDNADETVTERIVVRNSNTTPADDARRNGSIILELDEVPSSDIQNLRDMIADSTYRNTLIRLSSVLRQLQDSTGSDTDNKLRLIDSVITNSELIREISINENRFITIIGNRSASISGWSETMPGVFTWQKTIASADIREVSTNLPVGNITIKPVTGDESTITLSASGSVEDPTDLTQQFNTHVNVADGVLLLELKRISSDSMGDIQLEATLEVPANSVNNAYTGGGHIQVTGINADLTLESGGGHIQLSDVKGEVLAVTKGGHISLNGGVGEVNAKTGGGHIHITDLRGNLNSSSSGGNVFIEGLQGELLSSTKGGNISIILNELSGDVNAYSDAGNISIRLPAASRFNAEIEGTNMLDISGFSFESRVRKEDLLRISMRDALYMIRAHTRFGSISVEADE